MEKYIIILGAMLNDKAIMLTNEALEDIKDYSGDKFEEGVFKVTAIEDGIIRVWSEPMDAVFDVHVDDIITDEVTNEDWEKNEVINKIQAIIKEWGGFQMSDECLANESAIIINQVGETSSSAFAFNEDGVECDIYVGYIETDSETFDYVDLDLDKLKDILFLAEIHEATEERGSDSHLD